MKPFHLLLCAFLLPPLAGLLPAQPVRDEHQDDAASPPPEASRHSAQIERANALIQDGKAAAAVEILRPIAEQDLAELGAQSPFVVKAFNNLAYALSADRRHEEARETAYRALEFAQNQGDSSVGTAMVKRTLSDIALALGDFPEARIWIEDCCRDLEAAYGRTPMVAEAREQAARIAFSQGELDAAQEHLARALAIHERFLGYASETTARPLGPLALIAAQRGQIGTAVLLRGTERSILKSAGVDAGPEWFQAMEQELGLLIELGERDQAANLAQEFVAKLLAGEGSAEERFAALLAAGTTLLQTGAHEQALILLQEALAQAAALDSSEVAHNLRAALPLAQCKFLLKDAAGALAVLEAELPTDLETLDPALRSELRLLKSRSLLVLERNDEARALLLEVLHELREWTGADSPALRELLQAMLVCEARVGGASVEMVDLVEMIEQPATNTPPASLARSLRAAWERGEHDLAGPLVRGWMQLAQKKSERLELAADAIERARAREQIATLAWHLESAEALEHPAMGSHFAALRAIEAGARSDDGVMLTRPEFSGGSSRYTDLFAERKASLAKAREWLSGDAHALVQLLWSEAEAWAWVVRKDSGQDALINLGSASQLSQSIAAARSALSDFEQAADLGQLSQALLRPIEDSLAGVQRLTVLADGPLAFAPVEALTLKGGEFLLERMDVDYTTSLAALETVAPRASESGNFLHVGPITGHDELTLSHSLKMLRLRYAAALAGPERPDIGIVLPEGEQCWASEQAREGALAAASAAGKLRGLRALEFSTAAILDTQVPSASGLLLSPEASDDGRPAWRLPDGFLGLGEIAELDLGAELVLLPQAQFAGSDAADSLRSQALSAFVQSFFRAGAGALALTAFTTSDNRARLFDAALLAEVRANTPSSALNQTQRSWLQRARDQRNPSLLHPGIWARWRQYTR